jgi:nucleotide-binding universal stress UspA family protein
MFRPKRLVVPIDFSERATATAEHALALARDFGSELIFVHVVPRAPFEYAAFEGGAYTGAFWPKEEELEDNAKRLMDSFVEKVAPGTSVEKLVLKGDPATEIDKLTKDRPTDLVLIPTHGYGTFRRFVLGSVTSKLLHDLDCPIFTGAHIPELTPRNLHPYKRIACAVDLGENSERVLRWGWNLAKAVGADFTVIHAAPSLELGATYGDWFPVDARDVLVRGATERLKKLMTKVGCKAETHVDSGEAISYVARTAKEAQADVLVIGRSPKSGVWGRLRTHAYGIIRESPCPVISV